MKGSILYIGNKLAKHGRTPSGIEYLGAIFECSGYSVSYSSEYKNSMLRFLDMMISIFRRRSTTDLILIDTYSRLAFYYAFFSGLLSYAIGKPYILIIRGGEFLDRIRSSPGFCKYLFNRSARVVVVSKYLYSTLREFHPVAYIPNSIEIDNYAFKKRNILAPHLLWVRALHKVYNPLLAVRILSALKVDYPTAKLSMVGPDKDGSKKSLQHAINKLGLSDSITLVGNLQKAEWITYADSFNIFINTTTADNMPVSVMEAMAIGLPVVSTNVGGVPFLIDHELDGLLVPSGDLAAFLSAINRLVNDTALRNQIVESARLKVESFDSKKVIEKWNEIFQEITQ